MCVCVRTCMRTIYVNNIWPRLKMIIIKIIILYFIQITHTDDFPSTGSRLVYCNFSSAGWWTLHTINWCIHHDEENTWLQAKEFANGDKNFFNGTLVRIEGGIKVRAIDVLFEILINYLSQNFNRDKCTVSHLVFELFMISGVFTFLIQIGF